jgi:hypothetical protein
VSLSVTHNETGAAIFWLVFALEDFFSQSQEEERIGCNNTGGQREGSHLQAPHPLPVKKL